MTEIDKFMLKKSWPTLFHCFKHNQSRQKPQRHTETLEESCWLWFTFCRLFRRTVWVSLTHYAFEDIFTKSPHGWSHCCVLLQTAHVVSANITTWHIYALHAIKHWIANALTMYRNIISTGDNALFQKLLNSINMVPTWLQHRLHQETNLWRSWTLWHYLSCLWFQKNLFQSTQFCNLAWSYIL